MATVSEIWDSIEQGPIARKFRAIFRLGNEVRAKELSKKIARQAEVDCLTVAEVVEEKTDVLASSFLKMNLFEQLPLLEKTARVYLKNRGGRPVSGVVAKRRAKVKEYLAQGVKPGEIAAKLVVDVDTIYKDVQLLKSE